jgi:DNA-binding CsgD family transcriptional regulator
VPALPATSPGRIALEAYERDRGCLHSLDVFADLGAVRLAVADGRPTDAAGLATAAADHWRSLELGYAEAMCRYELVRLGDPAPADRLAKLAEACDGLLVAAFADQAAALRRDDGVALAEVAERFEAMGCALYATEAAMQASDAVRRGGDQRAANRLLARAAELRSTCETTVTAIPVIDSGPVALSKREREVALLAAQGMTSRAIAEQLFISSRTAENHLGKAYDKLGVRPGPSCPGVGRRDGGARRLALRPATGAVQQVPCVAATTRHRRADRCGGRPERTPPSHAGRRWLRHAPDVMGPNDSAGRRRG